jgi:hypothetical protein
MPAHGCIAEARALTPFLYGGGAAVEKLSHKPSPQEEMIVSPLHETQHLSLAHFDDAADLRPTDRSSHDLVAAALLRLIQSLIRHSREF